MPKRQRRIEPHSVNPTRSARAEIVRPLRPISVAQIVATALYGLTLYAALPRPTLAQTPTTQQPQDSLQEYRIPAGPLAPALRNLASAANVLLTFTPEQAEGKTANGLNGRYTLQGALDALLIGAGLKAVRLDNGSYVLREAAANASSTGEQEVRTLGRISVTGTVPDQTEGTGSYAVPAVSLMKGTTSLLDIPQTVTVVTRQLMDDRNITSVYDALESVTGVTLAQSPQGGKYIYSRGFTLGTVQYDGIPLTRNLYGRANNYSSSMVYVDRVEVLRGAAGLLQGTGNASGAVNIVRRKPLASDSTSVEARAGSWDLYGGQVDVSRNLDKDNSLRARALVDYEDRHSYIDLVNNRALNLYGSLDYDLSPSTRLGLAISWEEAKGRPSMNGLPRYIDGTELGLPRSTYLGGTWNRGVSSNRGLYADLTHAFNENWNLKISGVHIKEDSDFKFAGINRAVDLVLQQTATNAAISLVDLETYGIDANITGQFHAFGQQHELVAGASYAYTENITRYAYKLNYYVFNVFDYHHEVSEPADEEIYASYREDAVGRDKQFGAYSALRLKLADPLTLVVGARASWTDKNWRTVTSYPSTSENSYKSDAKISPYAGLIHHITPQVAAYVSYSDIFDPQNRVNSAGHILKPITGSNYEAGVKGEFVDGKTNASLSIFRINQKNRAQVDYSSGSNCWNNTYCYTDAGEVRSQGVDVEAQGRVTDSWEIFAGYTFNESKYIKDISNQGAVFSNLTPKHIFRMWTTYQLPGALRRVTLGGGVNAQTDTFVNIGSVKIINSDRIVVDGFLKYRVDARWSLSANVNNLFDKTYWQAADALVNGNYYGEPRRFTLRVKGSF